MKSEKPSIDEQAAVKFYTENPSTALFDFHKRTALPASNSKTPVTAEASAREEVRQALIDGLGSALGKLESLRLSTPETASSIWDEKYADLEGSLERMRDDLLAVATQELALQVVVTPARSSPVPAVGERERFEAWSYPFDLHVSTVAWRVWQAAVASTAQAPAAQSAKASAGKPAN